MNFMKREKKKKNEDKRKISLTVIRTIKRGDSPRCRFPLTHVWAKFTVGQLLSRILFKIRAHTDWPLKTLPSAYVTQFEIKKHRTMQPKFKSERRCCESLLHLWCPKVSLGALVSSDPIADAYWMLRTNKSIAFKSDRRKESGNGPMKLWFPLAGIEGDNITSCLLWALWHVTGITAQPERTRLIVFIV